MQPQPHAMTGTVFLIPTFLHPQAPQTLPAYLIDAIKACQVFFVENERTTRRYFKMLWRDMVIDDYTWVTIDKVEKDVELQFVQHLQQGSNIGIVSEAGCPGIADPGQILVAAAQAAGATVKPLVGPSAILLALMGSGLSGQRFQFCGYLPIDASARRQAIRDLESQSHKNNCTQVFIETPYRNNQLIADLLQTCRTSTRLCIAVDITAPTEAIQTKTIGGWKQLPPDFHKRLAIFVLHAGE